MTTPSALALIQMRPGFSRGRGIATTAAHLSRRRRHGQVVDFAVPDPMANEVPMPPQLPQLDLQGCTSLGLDVHVDADKLTLLPVEVAIHNVRPLIRCRSPDSGYAVSRRGSATVEYADDKGDVVVPALIEEAGCSANAIQERETRCSSLAVPASSSSLPALLFAAALPRTRSSCVELLDLPNGPTRAQVQPSKVSPRVGTPRIYAPSAQQQHAQPQKEVQQQQVKQQQQQPQVDTIASATPVTKKPSIKGRAKRFVAAAMGTIKATFRRNRGPTATVAPAPAPALPYKAPPALAKAEPLVLARFGVVPDVIADSFAVVEAHGTSHLAVYRVSPPLSATASVEAMYDPRTGVRVAGNVNPNAAASSVFSHALVAKRAYRRLAQPLFPSSSPLVHQLLRTDGAHITTIDPAPATADDGASPNSTRTQELATLVAKSLACPSHSAQRNALAALLEHLALLTRHQETTRMSAEVLAILWATPLFENVESLSRQGDPATAGYAAQRVHDAAIALLVHMIEHSGVFVAAMDEFGGVNVVDDE